jgi:hypothetical protein
MNVHLHRTRKIMGWVIGIVAFSPFILCLDFSNPKNTLSDVTGRVTYSGQPLNETTLCLLSMTEGRAGAYRGRYNAHLYTHTDGPSLPAKYADSATSGVEVEIDADWSELNIDLH